ncbi:zinc-dependent alcohol dehydrogenase [Natrinema sp. 1APR25-10V2]|uniref:zinc-dependent alcohol dehydrogenase n=1 Tax=Natrinema sp. 1APR25-10V2 TaxID=2951081 RepID=UPI0028766433|nr:zinc-dependent alcohol dehydrogenase [Natrinema sp. 1APR25-10V2]MDS0476734.1 glutathione-dependent formaldehyde dehydrogenase [Natrinema sp. 1APR25-10V2]
MKALTWHGEEDVRVDDVPDPELVNPHDAIVEITATAICGSDLHLYDGYVPTMREGDVLGHEPMGEVVAVGDAVETLESGDRVVVPFTISCGSCWFCEQGMYSLCDNSNPNAEMARKVMGQSPAGLFGYSHMLGGYAGGQAEYLRVPYADVGPIAVDSDLPDEQVLLLSDVFPTGYMAAENAEIEEDDTVAVWGCGPVGQFAIQSAWMFDAGRVIAIDRVPERLAMAREHGDAETIHFEDEDVYDRLMAMTGGRGPDRCIDAVGTEAHGTGLMGLSDKAKQQVNLEADRPHVLRQAIRCCRKGGTLSVPGVYVGHADNVPVGPLMNKALTVNTGQTHVQRYLDPLLEKIEDGEIDPSFVVTHEEPLDRGPEMYETFRDKEDGCVKVVLTP